MEGILERVDRFVAVDNTAAGLKNWWPILCSLSQGPLSFRKHGGKLHLLIQPAFNSKLQRLRKTFKHEYWGEEKKKNWHCRFWTYR